MLREALISLLSLEDDIEVAAEAENGQAAWEAIVQHEPDVCLLDIEMPSLTGLEIAEKMKEKGVSTKIIILTIFSRPGFLQKAMALKVDGYLLKDEPIDFLIDSIRKVMRGDRVLRPRKLRKHYFLQTARSETICP